MNSVFALWISDDEFSKWVPKELHWCCNLRIHWCSSVTYRPKVAYLFLGHYWKPSSTSFFCSLGIIIEIMDRLMYTRWLFEIYNTVTSFLLECVNFNIQSKSFFVMLLALWRSIYVANAIGRLFSWTITARIFKPCVYIFSYTSPV